MIIIYLLVGVGLAILAAAILAGFMFSMFLGNPWWATAWAIVGIMLVLALIFVRRADAAEWNPLVRQCVAEAEQQAGCTSACVNSTWPKVAQCVNARAAHHFPPGRLEVCIRQVQAARVASGACELCGDPVVEALACAGH